MLVVAGRLVSHPVNYIAKTVIWNWRQLQKKIYYCYRFDNINILATIRAHNSHFRSSLFFFRKFSNKFFLASLIDLSTAWDQAQVFPPLSCCSKSLRNQCAITFILDHESHNDGCHTYRLVVANDPELGQKFLHYVWARPIETLSFDHRAFLVVLLRDR